MSDKPDIEYAKTVLGCWARDDKPHGPAGASALGVTAIEWQEARIAALEADLASQVAWKGRYMREVLQAGERIRELEAAIRWALGEEGEFPDEPEPQGKYRRKYYWRTELRKRACISLESPVSTLCAVCDQIKELHPSSHPWTARTVAETAGEHGLKWMPADQECSCEIGFCRKQNLGAQEHCRVDRLNCQAKIGAKE